MERSQYKYESAQGSILRPYYQKWIWQPLLDFVPQSWSPNVLTVISTFSCALSFLLAATLSQEPLAMLLAAFLVFAYSSLDNMDGDHARRTGQSSRLGEFLDHWLDTINNGFVILGACLAVGLPTIIALAVLAIGSLAFFAVQLELRYTGVFRMGALGDIEGNSAVSLLYIAIAIGGPQFFLIQPIQGLPSIAILIGIGVAGQSILTAVSAFRKLENGRGAFAPIVLSFLFLTGWLMTGVLSGNLCLVIAFLLNPVFTSRPILARLLNYSTVKADWLAVCAVAVGFLFGLIPSLAQFGTLAGLGVSVALLGIVVSHCSATAIALRNETLARS